MPVPPQCQPIVDEIADLEGQIEDLTGLAGKEKWAALQKNVQITKAISQKQSLLEQCVLLHAPGYETDVVIFDLTGTTAAPAEGRLWRLDPTTGDSVIENQNVRSGRLRFVHGGSNPGRFIGISIHEAANPTFIGPLFRSGSFASLPPGSPANPNGLIEIGVVDAVPVAGAVLSAGLPAPSAIPVPVGVTVISLALTLGTGTATITVLASVPISIGFGILPITYSLTFGINPSFNMNDLTEICLVVPTGPGVITTPLGGMFNIILGTIASIIEPGLTASVVAAIQGLVNRSILAAAASAIGQSALPAEVVVSMRQVVITPRGILFFPALGAYGGLLNRIPIP